MPSLQSGSKSTALRPKQWNSITAKLKRGTFPVTFFAACLAALELDGVALKEI